MVLLIHVNSLEQLDSKNKNDSMKPGVFVNWWEVDVYMIGMPSGLKVTCISPLLNCSVSFHISIYVFIYIAHSIFLNDFLFFSYSFFCPILSHPILNHL